MLPMKHLAKPSTRYEYVRRYDMNLTSCGSCGVVIDTEKIAFPDSYNADDTPSEFSEWNGYEFVAYIECPVCSNKILEE